MESAAFNLCARRDLCKVRNEMPPLTARWFQAKAEEMAKEGNIRNKFNIQRPKLTFFSLPLRVPTKATVLLR